MQTVWSFSLLALWAVVLVNLLLTLRIVRLLRAQEAMRKRLALAEQLPELTIGEPAPDFTARALAGGAVTRQSYVGQSVALLFISPHCGHCRRELPMLQRLAPLARAQANVSFVLVSDSSVAETQAWLRTIRAEDGLDVTLPTLVAPRTTYDFILTYNPRGLSPYYCLLDAQGLVQARGPLGVGDWPALQRAWSGASAERVSPRLPSRYR